MNAPIGAEVVIWCEDKSHDTPVRIVGLRRLADGTVRENGYVHRPPRLWVGDATERQMGHGPTDASGIPEWYDTPRPGRVLQKLDENGARLRCPPCGHARPLTWAKLSPILEAWGEAGVSRLTLQALARIVR